jgi:predicted unusual protein kinase regulating ubiquinone biosynthesis (AarF/ABC1/UbiB family)
MWFQLLQRMRPPHGPGAKYTPEFMAVYTRVTIERFGGLWIKATQILPMCRELFSKTFCDELGKLHDQAQGLPGDRPWGKWDEMYWALQQTLSDEFEYRLEVASMRRMRRTLRHDKVCVPKAFTRWCKKRVIVMEFIEGVLMSDYIHAIHDRPAQARAWRKENNVSTKKIGRRLHLNVLKQGIEDNRGPR